MSKSDFDRSGKFCKSCGVELPVGRVKYSKALTCVKCSDTQKLSAFPVISGKTTYSEIQFLDQDSANKLHKAQYRRGQSPGYGMKGTSKLH